MAAAWLWATGLGLGAVTIAGGAQAVATRADRRRLPPPGRMIDVGGYRLHLVVEGDDLPGPTVVLEAGLGSFSPNWFWVQQEVSAFARVVAYDRAGLGWSDAAAQPRDARRMATELHAALHAAGLAPPFVLAGHSFGGLVVRAFADRFPDEVAGLVLVDASHQDQWVRWPTPGADRLLAAAQRVTALLAALGVVRALDLFHGVTDGLPPRQVAELNARFAVPRTSLTEARQLAAWRTTSRAQLNAARPLGDLPVFVLGVTEQPLGAATLDALQAQLGGLSTNSSRHVVQGATHESLVAHHDHARVVASAIHQVLDAARDHRPLVGLETP